jgi:hypothetical protein
LLAAVEMYQRSLIRRSSLFFFQQTIIASLRNTAIVQGNKNAEL